MTTNNMVLQCKDGGDFTPHPEGIHPAVCVDVVDLGLVDTEFQGQRRVVHKVKLVFETEQRTEDGKPFTVSKNFTASLHPKAKLAEFLGKWRGRPVVPGETIDLSRLTGACCTLVISHQQNNQGRTYGSIDAVSKPTKKVTPSGTHDAVALRQRIAEWKAKQGQGGRIVDGGSKMVQNTSPRPAPRSGGGTDDDVPWGNAPGGGAQRTDAGEGARATTGAGPAAAAVDEDVGF